MKQETKQEMQLTEAQLTGQKILSLPPHPDYVPVPDMPLPLSYGVIVKPIKREVELLTSGILTAEGENTNDTCEGIIYAVGPACSPFLRVGLKCIYSAEAKTEFRHKNQFYKKMDEFSVFFIVPDLTTRVDNGVKSDKEMGRKKRIERQKYAIKVESKRFQNEKDKSKDKTKGKIRVVK
nr:hypothetical protein [uncultured Flavobacterium sp.]